MSVLSCKIGDLYRHTTECRFTVAGSYDPQLDTWKSIHTPKDFYLVCVDTDYQEYSGLPQYLFFTPLGMICVSKSWCKTFLEHVSEVA